MGNYTNPNHPAGELYPQNAGFLHARPSAAGGGARHGSLAAESYRTWVTGQVARAKKVTAPATRRKS